MPELIRALITTDNLTSTIGLQSSHDTTNIFLERAFYHIRVSPEGNFHQIQLFLIRHLSSPFYVKSPHRIIQFSANMLHNIILRYCFHVIIIICFCYYNIILRVVHFYCISCAGVSSSHKIFLAIMLINQKQFSIQLSDNL